MPIFNEKVLDQALKAMLDCEKRAITLTNGDVIYGWVWEIYRSIQTRSVRIRCSDKEGYVYHYNTLDVQDISLVEHH